MAQPNVFHVMLRAPRAALPVALVDVTFAKMATPGTTSMAALTLTNARQTFRVLVPQIRSASILTAPINAIVSF